MPDVHEHPDNEVLDDGHATTGGAAAAGAVTGGLAGAAVGGPVGAVAGAIGGAAIGAGTERAMHGEPGHEHREGDERHFRGDHTHTGDDCNHDHTHHYDLGYGTDTTRRAATGDQVVKLREEELRARKERVEAGQVEVRKDVVAEQRTLEVPVTREEVVVERHAVNRPSDRPIGAESEVIAVPVYEEQVTAEKQTVVREELEVGKRAVPETQPVSGTVRREEARIEQTGHVRGAGDWASVMPRYRSRWEQRHGSRGGRWEDYEPGYRYGWEMANDQRYRGRRWADVESGLRRDWETRHRDKPWDRFADAVRDAWANITH